MSGGMEAQCIQYEGMGVTLMGRLEGNGGASVTQATLTAIRYNVTRYASYDDASECRNGTAVITGGTLAKTSVIFDTLQTPAIWTTDETGYGFRYDSPETDRPATSGGGTYWHRYDITFDPASGANFPGVFIVESKPFNA